MVTLCGPQSTILQVLPFIAMNQQATYNSGEAVLWGMVAHW